MSQCSLGWVIAVIHNPAARVYTALHIASQWNQILSAIFSDTLSTGCCLPFNSLSRKASTEVLEWKGNLSTVLYPTSLQNKHIYPYQYPEKIIQMNISNDGDITTLLSRLSLCPVLGHVCTWTCVQVTFFLLQPRHCFHHIVQKCKAKCRHLINSSFCRTAFSKSCKIVSFIFNVEGVS